MGVEKMTERVAGRPMRGREGRRVVDRRRRPAGDDERQHQRRTGSPEGLRYE
jgi:hypothetical protein